jgi:hypothetical protein
MQIEPWHVLTFFAMLGFVSGMVGLIIKSSEHAR